MLKKILFILLVPIIVIAYSDVDIFEDHLLYYPVGNKILRKDFIPTDLVSMKDYGIYVLRPKSNEGKIRRVAVYDLKEFQDFCNQKTGINIPVRSGYRSYGDQYMAFGTHGSKGGSAQPGTSEHQLGLAVDFGERNFFVDEKLYPKFSKCLSDNAYLFGFVLSYNYGNPHYVYEPWHYRYVGKKYAAIIKDKGLLETPWVFLEKPEMYLNDYVQRNLAIIKERKEKIKNINQIQNNNKYYLDEIFGEYNFGNNFVSIKYFKNYLLTYFNDNNKDISKFSNSIYSFLNSLNSSDILYPRDLYMGFLKNLGSGSNIIDLGKEKK